MNSDFLINIFLLLSYFVFVFACLLHVERRSFLNKTIFYFNLLFLIVTNLLVYLYKLYIESNNLTIISSLSLIIFLIIYFLLCLFSHTFIRLRLIFLPFFLILYVFFILSNFYGKTINYELDLFNDKFLITHILSSLFAYCALTISAITSVSVFIQERIIKKLTYNKYFSSLLPSIYEGELLTIRFLYFSLLFLIISLISGYYYIILEYADIKLFFNEKSILSILAILMIIILLILRYFFGLSGKITLRIILLSYFFINFSYFGIRFIN